jgi:F0F1-type ATP synthase delta subunit
MAGRKSVIKFDLMNKKLALVLGKEPKTLNALETSLKSKGFEVEVCSSSSQLFSKLEDGKLGYVLISCAISPLTTHPVADLIQRKFSVPILFYSEGDSSSLIGGSLFEMTPEIHYLVEKEPEKVPEEVDDFERIYSEKKAALLARLAQSKEGPKGDLVKNLLQLILNKSEPLKEPLTKDIVSVFHCQVEQNEHRADLYFACPPDKVNSEVQDEIQKTLSAFLGYEITLKKIIEEIQIDKVESFNSESAAISGVWNSVPARVSVLPEIEGEVETQDGFILVPYGTWWTQIRSAFRAYLLLKANKKQILYMKAGDLLREESLERFEKKGVKSMGVAPQDYEAWRATNHLFERKKAA